MPETALIRCPHCNHALSLPSEFLGRAVTCLQCQNPFLAPVLEGDLLTEPQKLLKKSRIPPRIFIPMYGMMLLGFTGVLLNAYLWFWFQSDPMAASQFAEANLFFMLETKPPETTKVDPKAKATAEDEAARKKRAEEFGDAQGKSAKNLAQNLSVDSMKRVRLIFGAVSFGVLVGSFCFALRRAYYYCMLACLLSAVNSPDLGCCFIGGIVGIWGFMMLISEEGRDYFRRTPPLKAG
jgi:hypothetical protein